MNAARRKLAALMALALTALPLGTLPVGAAGGDHVVIIGDNATAAARADITTQFATRAWTVDVDAESGRGASSAADLVRQHEGALKTAKAVVIQLGTFGQGGDFAAEVNAATTAARRIRDDLKIYWVDIASNADGTGKDGSTVSQPIANAISTYSSRNAAIHDGANNYTTIGWFRNVFPQGDPKAISATDVDAAGLLANDEYTLSENGAAALARLLADVVAGYGTSLSQALETSCLVSIQRELIFRTQDIEFTDGNDCERPPCEAVGISLVSSSSVTDRGKEYFEQVRSNIELLKPDYVEAARQAGISWQILAALHYVEANNNPEKSMFAGEDLGSPNPDNQGQVMGNTRQENYLRAANFFKAKATSVYNVNIGTNNNEQELGMAFLAWNRGVLYKRVPAEHGGPWNYLKHAYTMAEYSPEFADMKWASEGTGSGGSGWGERPSTKGKPFGRVGALAVFALLSSAGSVSPADCSGAGGTVSANGLTFPLITTQKIIRGGADGIESNGDEWCYAISRNCHGTRGADFYHAEDIHVPGPDSGKETAVVAAVDGKVTSVNDGTVSLYIQIDGVDGNTYLYIHLHPGSAKVAIGDTVPAGTPLAVVGNSSAAEGTAPHLHFDAHPTGSISQGVNRECVRSGACKDEAAKKIDYHPALVDLFKKLPED